MNSLNQGLLHHFSQAQLERLRAAKVAILGCGGLGSNLAFMLVRSGIRRFRLIDPDLVSASNLNRQAFFPEDVGKPKVTALAAHLLRLEPALELFCAQEALTRENAPLLAFGPAGENGWIAIEAVDDAVTKAMLFEAISPAAAFYATASGLAGLGRPEAPMQTRNINERAVLVGDSLCGVGSGEPPLAPRVMEAAALQANAVLRHILRNTQIENSSFA